MMSKKIICFLISSALAGSLNAASLSKEHTGWYVGGEVGSMNVEAESDLGLSEKGTTGSIGVYGGYNFTHFFGLEMTLLNSDDVAESSGIESYYLPIIFTPKFTYQITDTFALYGKVGLALTSYMMEDKNPLPFADEEIMWSGAGLTIGIGTQISFTKNLNMRVAYDYIESTMEADDDYYDGVAIYEVEDIDVSSGRLSVGLHCQF